MKTTRLNSHEVKQIREWTHEILVKHYVEQIREWKWNEIVNEANSNLQQDEWGERRGTYWLGTIMGLAPSGKAYTCWTTNQTSSDIRKDDAFWDALEKIADEKDGYITFENDEVFFGIGALDQPTDESEDICDGEHYDTDF